MVGADVCALYPAMDQVATGEIAAQAIRDSTICFKGMDYKSLAIYLFLNLGPDVMLDIGLGEIIPMRIGDSENVTSRSLLSRSNKIWENWYVDVAMLTDDMKREMIAQMIKLAILVMMTSTCYSFGGLLFLQLIGAGIGLRGSAALAKITMGKWDKVQANILHSWTFLVKIFICYIDDVRIFAHPIKKGWYWTDNGWQFDANSDDNRSPIERTCEELKKVFESIMDFLKFTTESELDFQNGYLPTLDVELKVSESGLIVYRFFSKPMKNNQVIQKGTALSKDIVFSSLRQEVNRRMSNTGLMVPWSVRLEVLENLIQLMLNSGHKYSFIKSVILQGLTKYEFMRRKSELNINNRRYMPINRPRDFRAKERITELELG